MGRRKEEQKSSKGREGRREEGGEGRRGRGEGGRQAGRHIGHKMGENIYKSCIRYRTSIDKEIEYIKLITQFKKTNFKVSKEFEKAFLQKRYTISWAIST